MTPDRSSLDRSVTDAMRALYAAPTDARYWTAFEARILAHVARGRVTGIWYRELADMLRPGLLAAAGLVLAATLAMLHSRRAEARNAYATVISPSAVTLDVGARGFASGDGDAAMHFILSH